MDIIYFLQRDNGDIKIGTTIDFKMRLIGLEREHGKLTLLGVMLGSYEKETELHELFSANRIGRGEFFTPTPALYKFINENTSFEIPDGAGASKSVVIKESTRDRLKEFARGMNGSYSDAVNSLIQLTVLDGETIYDAAKRLSGKSIPRT